MLIPLPAVILIIAGAAIWGGAFWWGPCFGYLDLETKRRLMILAGAVCFAAAGAFLIWSVLA